MCVEIMKGYVKYGWVLTKLKKEKEKKKAKKKKTQMLRSQRGEK